MNTNRVSATLSTTDQDAVMTAIATIREKLPFLIDLSTTERASMLKLGDKSLLFDTLAPIRLAVDHMKAPPEPASA